jgi:threonine aldolase
MMEAIARAPLGDDVYGEDPTVKKLEQLAAGMLGKEAALLVPSGTMANLIALMVHCPRGTKVVVGDETDIYIYEAGGASVLGGLVYEPVPTQPDGRLALEDLSAAFPDDPSDPQFALPGVICLENPHNRCGGKVLPLRYLQEVRAFADTRGVPVHMDGARIFNAAVALDVPASVIAATADSVQFCLSKGLSAPVGSMLVGSRAFIEKAHRLRKMLGGGMRQAGILAAAGIVSLERMVGRLAEDHQNARRFAEGLRSMPGVTLADPEISTNMVFFRVVDPRFTLQSFLRAAARRGLHLGELGHGRIRAATHSGVSMAQVDEALAIVRSVLEAGPDA